MIIWGEKTEKIEESIHGEKVLFFEGEKIEINLRLEIWNRDLQEKEKYERSKINSREGGEGDAIILGFQI